ncbi:MAG: 3'-5' exonuclease, partial [Polyangiaceae bacterium]
FFDRAAVKDLMSYLRVIVNPQSDVDLLRIINKPPRKIGKTTIDKLVKMAAEEECSVFDAIVPLCSSDRIKKGAKRALRAFDEMIQGFARASTTAGPRELAEDVLSSSGYAEWLTKQDSAEADARLDNLRELLGSIAEYEEDAAYAEETPSLSEYLTRTSLQSDADTMEEVPRVPMMTVHAAKGLEFDVVCITGMEEKLFPLRGQEPGEEEELEEERRLAYVAITRARDHLYITHTNTRMIYGQVRYNTPARFLSEVPPKHQERQATVALRDLSRSYTLGGSPPTHREKIRRRAGGAVRPGSVRPGSVRTGSGRSTPFDSPASRQRTPMPEPPPRAAGERYIEQDDFVDDADFEGFDTFNLRVGARVRHPKFGVGEVATIGAGSNPSIAVKFPGWGIKRIKLNFLRPA